MTISLKIEIKKVVKNINYGIKRNKKILYKQNPQAYLSYIRKGHAIYISQLEIENGTKTLTITYNVPVSDMGEADFLATMRGKKLIRWIIN